MSFRSINIRNSYVGKGKKILENFVLPVLNEAVHYDRITAYFTIDSLLAISQGIESLFEKSGSMRLIIGVHSIPDELVEAISMHELLQEEIQEVRKEIQSKIMSLENALQKSRLATLAWMIEDGLLEVKAAAVRGGNIFHPKTLIFKDVEQNEIAAVGSSNETGNGLGGNFEQLMVAKSWENLDAVDDQKSFFNHLWDNQIEDVYVEDISIDTMEMISKGLGNESKRRTNFYFEDQIIEKLSKMPANFFVSGDIPSLYMHQERAVLDALSRWPVRVLLSDEVGLGKTFEAAAVLAFLVKYSKINRVVILTPKSVLKQWQDELMSHFGLDVWLYDSGRKEYRSGSGRTIVIGDANPLGIKSPDFVLMSAQYARGSRGKESVFLKQDTILPELLIVDEAHSARVSTDLSGKRTKTQMYKMLENIAKKIPHLILATATPMQKDALEYHAILKLLGMPKIWEKEDNFLLSLKLISSSERSDPSDAVNAGGLLYMTLKKMKPTLNQMEDNEKKFIRYFFLNFKKMDSFEKAEYIRTNWNCFKSIFIKLHPAKLLTVRNTRKALTDIGYRFPERNLEEINLYNSDEIEAFYSRVNSYLTNECFSIERALYPNRKINLGFIRISYQQRVASSLYSCKESLNKRFLRAKSMHDKIENNKTILPKFSFDISNSVDDIAEDEILFSDEDFVEALGSSRIDKGELLRAISIEQAALGSLIKQADKLLSSIGDKKVMSSLDLALKRISDDDSVLLFSRYTDTIDALICELNKRGYSAPYAIYTGNQALIVEKGKKYPSDKDDIKKALFSKKVRIVFCSDAASEGLNLQAARVLINVDVPWTPSRLEQRIGRIARLGQTASEVDIYNVWYPNSIEARMYKRIQARLRDTNIAVGEFPEVIAEGIRRAVIDGDDTDSNLDQLKNIRNSYQTQALELLWVNKVTRLSTSDKIRNDLIELCDRTFEKVEDFFGESVSAYRMPDGTIAELSEKCGIKESVNLKLAPFKFMDIKMKDVRLIVDAEDQVQYFSTIDGFPILFENILDIIIKHRTIQKEDYIIGWPKTLLNPNSLNLEYSVDCELAHPPAFWNVEKGEDRDEC